MGFLMVDADLYVIFHFSH